MRLFQAKISKIFCGGGTAPSTDLSPLAPTAPRVNPHPNFSPIFTMHTSTYCTLVRSMTYAIASHFAFKQEKIAQTRLLETAHEQLASIQQMATKALSPNSCNFTSSHTL